jgi:hypothetical protein
MQHQDLLSLDEYVLMLVAATRNYGHGVQNSSFYVPVTAADLKVEGKPTCNLWGHVKPNGTHEIIYTL